MPAYRSDEQLGVVVADAAKDSDDRLDEADVVHRLGQLDVTEVAWAVLHVAAISGAHHTTSVHGSHPEVAETTLLRLSLLIHLRGHDLCHRVFALQSIRMRSASLPELIPAVIEHLVRLTISSGSHTLICTALIGLIGADDGGNRLTVAMVSRQERDTRVLIKQP